MLREAMSSSDTLTFNGYLRLSNFAFTLRPVLVIVAPINLTTTSWLTRGRPLQFMLMCEKRRCLILFHFIVPGVNGQTVTLRSIYVAKVLSSLFHERITSPHI